MAQRELQQSFVGGEMSVRMFGRPSDVRFQHGAAKLQNLITTPQGPAQKRPGTAFVREIRDSTNRARLIPFVFSQDQTLMLEMGRSTVDSREIGYWRFHTQGSTLLFTLPPAYVAPATIDSLNSGTDEFTTLTPHGLATGDPVRVTMHPTTNVVTSFTVANPGKVVHALGSIEADRQVMFEGQSGGTLPQELNDRQIYYVRNSIAANFEVSKTIGGPSIEFTGAGSGTVNLAIAPFVPTRLDVGVTYFLINISASVFQLADTREDALAGVFKLTGATGTINDDDFIVHFDYRVGTLVTTGGLSYYCFRLPGGEFTHRNSGPEFEFLNVGIGEHTGHAPTDTNYWARLPGDHLVVTFDVPNDEVDWAAHPNSNGDTVIFSGGTPPTGIVLGTTYFIVNSQTNNFQIAATPGGTAIVFGGLPAGTTTALVQSIFEVPHFFDFTEILQVDYAQSNDVLTITHPNRPATQLIRLGPTNWVVGAIRFNGGSPPGDVNVVTTSGFGLQVVSVTAATPAVVTLVENHGGAALTTIFFLKGIGDIPDGLYVSTSAAGKTFDVAVLGDHTDQGSGTTDLGPDPIVQPNLTGTNFNQTYVVTSIGSRNEESGPSAEFSVVNHMGAPGAFNAITWSAVGGAVAYRIYKKETGIGVFGFIGEILAGQPLTFEDNDVAPDLSITAPILDEDLRNLAIVTFDATNDRVNLVDHGFADGSPVVFQGTGTLPPEITAFQTYFVVSATDDSFSIALTSGGAAIDLTTTGAAAERFEVAGGLFPASVAYFEQRRCFAGSTARRQRVSMTAAGTESDLSFSIPTVDSDRISFEVAARESGAIRHIVPISHLMILSDSTEYRVTPINSDAITPTSISIRPQSFVGANEIQPAIVNNNAIFAAARGGHVREMGFSQNVLSYLTGDLSLRATHLFDGLTIEQIAYSKAPQPIIWFVSSGGKLLGLTYLPEEQIGGWHQHVTDGTYESCALIAEGEEDHLYVIVKRTINSVTVRYVERMANLDVTTLAAGFFVDAGLTYSGVPATVITGLDHLEGESVAVLADGLVVKGLTVSSGQITLTTAASTVHVGMPFTVELETLPVTLQLPAGALDKTKNVNAVWVRVEESGAFSIGPTLNRLTPTKLPVAGALLTGTVDVAIEGSWQEDGKVFVQQSDPVPLTLVSMVYEIQPGG